MTHSSDFEQRELLEGDSKSKSVSTERRRNTTAMNAWHSFASFCDESWSEFTPRSENNQRLQRPAAKVERACAEIVMEGRREDWQQVVKERFKASGDLERARSFFRHVFRKERRGTSSLLVVFRKLEADVARFADLAEDAFGKTGAQRDLIRLNAMADIIRSYQGPERTYLFLFSLSRIVDEEGKNVLLNSRGFGALVHWGASRFLKEFWLKLQQRFRITRVALKDEAARNLARELGETEAHLRDRLEASRQRVEELEAALEKLRDQAREQALDDFARGLQNRPTPILDQMFGLYRKLKEREEIGEPLSGDLLGVFIVLEEMLGAFESLGISFFPGEPGTEMELQGDELGAFSYVEGSPFSDENDVKRVLCIHPGWKIGEKVISPARVREVKGKE